MNAEEFYDSNAAQYDGALFAALPYTVEKRFDRLFSLPGSGMAAKGLRILEIGAGTGAYSAKLLALEPGKLTVTDISGGMLDVARSKLGAAGSGVDFQRCGCEALPFEDKSFDLVVCFACCHHFADRGAAFREMARVLDDSGRLLMMEPNPLHPLNFLLGLVKKIERGMLSSWPGNWRREAGKAGLECAAFRYGSFFPGWPTELVGVYDRVERLLIRIPVLRNFAIFGFYCFRRR